MKLLLIVSTVLVTSLADRLELEERFDQFRTQFGKHYDSWYRKYALGTLYSITTDQEGIHQTPGYLLLEPGEVRGAQPQWVLLDAGGHPVQ